ncbi:MAG: NAD-dependent epimerase/dehydratase family protein [Halanaerobiaceae bacterium]
MPQKKVLITGYTGVVGEVLVEGLKDIYNLSGISRNPVEMDGIDVFQADITDKDSLYEPFSNVDTVLHLAAEPSIYAEWDSVLTNNIEGVYNVFSTAKEKNVKRIVFASTNHVTGIYTKKRKPMNAEMPVAPDSLYGVSKVFGEALGRYYAEYFDLSVFSLRIGWICREDTPLMVRDEELKEELYRMWLSHRDLVDMVKKCINAPQDIKHQIFYCMSDNLGSLWDHSDAKTIVGYNPRDDSSTYLKEDRQWFQG